MKYDHPSANSSIDFDELCGEDPYREPFEKETALHLEGDRERIEVTSFKEVVYRKLLQRPEFEPKYLSVCDGNRRERTVPGIDEIIENPELRVIGATGTLPVGALTIGTPRKSNSHAQIVKK